MKKEHALILLVYLRKTAALVFLVVLLGITADMLRFITMLIASPTTGIVQKIEDHPYEREVSEATMHILVAGDSTAVGVGAYTPKETIAGMISEDVPDATIENIAVSGARVSDVVKQLEDVIEQYDIILIQAGANDIIFFSNENDVRESTEEMVRQALGHTDLLIVVAPFDVSIAPLLPRIAGPIFSLRSADILFAMREIVEKEEGVFIDLYKSKEEELFMEAPDTLFSADAFHPSSDGYELAYERIKRELCEREIFLTLCGR